MSSERWLKLWSNMTMTAIAILVMCLWATYKHASDGAIVRYSPILFGLFSMHFVFERRLLVASGNNPRGASVFKVVAYLSAATAVAGFCLSFVL